MFLYFQGDNKEEIGILCMCELSVKNGSLLNLQVEDVNHHLWISLLLARIDMNL